MMLWVSSVHTDLVDASVLLGVPCLCPLCLASGIYWHVCVVTTSN